MAGPTGIGVTEQLEGPRMPEHCYDSASESASLAEPTQHAMCGITGMQHRFKFPSLHTHALNWIATGRAGSDKSEEDRGSFKKKASPAHVAPSTSGDPTDAEGFLLEKPEGTDPRLRGAGCEAAGFQPIMCIN